MIIDIYINKDIFKNQLYQLSINDINIILEKILIELNLSTNNDIFFNAITNGLRGIEFIGKKTGFDLDNITNELMNDEDFKLTLKMVACELDITKYMNPRRAALMFLVKKIYEKHFLNKLKNDTTNNMFKNNEKNIDELKKLEDKYNIKN